MCGIGGIVARTPQALARIRVDAMVDALRHRGPDGEGSWRSPDGRVAMVHTRLAIVDLSSRGAQPMVTSDGRFQIVFNGEIYNHAELRRDLEAQGHLFHSTSDTEVLLHLFAQHGEGALGRLDGMFAFAVHDARDHRLYCARDPLGEKPLYVTRSAEYFALASEVTALVRAGASRGTLDPRGIGLLLRQGSIPPPYTHVSDVELLEPGTCLQVDTRTLEIARRRWWQLPFVAERDLPRIDRTEAVQRITESLLRSTTRRLRADVPLAAFLSGGIDSAMVCALMLHAGARDLATFTLTLPGHPDDESLAARRTACALGTKHVEIPLELDSDWLDRALDDMDVPSDDGPNTWLVARATRDAGFKVACSGVGGDELFFGYSTFSLVPRAAKLARPLRPLDRFRAWGRAVAQRIPSPPRLGRVVDAALSGGDLAAMWLAKRGLFSEREVSQMLRESFWTAAREVDPIERIAQLPRARGLAPEREISCFELLVYLHDQVLRDTDAMTMAHGLELRLPLIGLPVVEQVARTPTSLLVGDRPKAVLREIAKQFLPGDLAEGAKRGFVLNWASLLGVRRGRREDDLPMLRTGVMDLELRRLREEGRGHARVLALEALAAVSARTTSARPPTA